MAKRCKRIVGPKQALAAMRERVFVVRKGEDGDAVLVEWPAPGQKRPASGRDVVGPSGAAGPTGKASRRRRSPLPCST